MSVITLTTDFGIEDAYVGVMKGVILGLNPQATIVDLCHHIEPQNVLQAGFLLHTSYRYFPPGTIHLVVIDPGVGTGRKAILVSAAGSFFLAPDNGVLSYVMTENPAFQACHLDNPEFWLPQVSATFHGRDIFAPVAAHLSLGVPPQKLGMSLASPLRRSLPLPRQEKGQLHGQVLHVDRFGNLITNIPASQLPSKDVKVVIEGRSLELRETYAQGEDLLAIIGSSGYVEVAQKDGHAARFLGVGMGCPVQVITGEEAENVTA